MTYSNMTINELLNAADMSDNELAKQLAKIIDTREADAAEKEAKESLAMERLIDFHVKTLEGFIESDMQRWREDENNLANYYECLESSISYYFNAERLQHIVEYDICENTERALLAYFKTDQLSKDDLENLIEIITYNELYMDTTINAYGGGELVIASMDLGEDEQENKYFVDKYCEDNLPEHINADDFKEAFYKEHGEYSYYYDHTFVGFKLDQIALVEYLETADE